jgi:Pretoxin HINT domain
MARPRRIDDRPVGGDSRPDAQAATEPRTGTVLAKDGSEISWTIAADGTLTALGENNHQLVVSKYRPRRLPGTDARGAVGDRSMGTRGPSGSSSSGGDMSIGDGGNSDSTGTSTASASGAAEDPGWGLEFAYSTVGQGDPYLTIREVVDLQESASYLNITGLTATAKIRMSYSGDPTRVPSAVSAKFPRRQVLDWAGPLDLTESPFKALARIPGWRFHAFDHESTYAAYFDPLTPVIVDAFGESDTAATEPGDIARKTAAGILGRAAAWGVGGAIAGGLGGAGVPGAVAGAIGGFAASLGSDIWSMVTDDLEDIPDDELIPPDPDVEGTEEPDEGCFAEGTVVALRGQGRAAIDSIVVGDEVVARAESSLEEGARKVTRTWRHPRKRAWDVRLDTGERIRTTASHRFFTVERGIVAAAELRVGDRLKTLGGEPRAIVGLRAGPDNVTVYNLTVDELHTYFVGEAAVWVHNEKTTTHDDPPPEGDGDDTGDPDGGSSTDSGSSTRGGSTSGGGSAPPPT